MCMCTVLRVSREIGTAESVPDCKAQSMHHGSQYCCLQWLNAIVTIYIAALATRTMQRKSLIKCLLCAAQPNDRPLILHCAVPNYNVSGDQLNPNLHSACQI